MELQSLENNMFLRKSIKLQIKEYVSTLQPHKRPQTWRGNKSSVPTRPINIRVPLSLYDALLNLGGESITARVEKAILLYVEIMKEIDNGGSRREVKSDKEGECKSEGEKISTRSSAAVCRKVRACPGG